MYSAESDEEVFLNFDCGDGFSGLQNTVPRVSSPSSVSGGAPPSQMQKITLRRHRSTGFGFRPAGGNTVQPIVASVIKVCSFNGILIILK